MGEFESRWKYLKGRNSMSDRRTEMPPSDAVRELATLLALGIVRLHSQPRLAADTSLKLSESAAQALEFPGESRLSVTTG